MLSAVTQAVAMLGIIGVICYIAVVSLSNSNTWLGLIALLASLAALAILAQIMAGNPPGSFRWRRLGNAMKDQKNWRDWLF